MKTLIHSLQSLLSTLLQEYVRLYIPFLCSIGLERDRVYKPNLLPTIIEVIAHEYLCEGLQSWLNLSTVAVDWKLNSVFETSINFRPFPWSQYRSRLVISCLRLSPSRQLLLQNNTKIQINFGLKRSTDLHRDTLTHHRIRLMSSEIQLSLSFRLQHPWDSL